MAEHQFLFERTSEEAEKDFDEALAVVAPVTVAADTSKFARAITDEDEVAIIDAYFVSGRSINQIARDRGHGRNTVQRIVREHSKKIAQPMRDASGKPREAAPAPVPVAVKTSPSKVRQVVKKVMKKAVAKHAQIVANKPPMTDHIRYEILAVKLGKKTAAEALEEIGKMVSDV